MALETGATLRLDEDDLAELTALAMNSDKLAEVVIESTNVGPTVGTVLLSEKIAHKIGLDSRIVTLMVNGLVHAIRIRDGFSATAEEVANIIVRSLKKLNRTDIIEVWKPAEAKIIETLNLLTVEHPLVLSADVGNEAQSTPNAVMSIEMSTGTRPVFSEQKDRILFTLITHTLSLEYHAGFRRHKEISLSLDASDVARLHQLCEEAVEAADTLKASINGPSAVPFEEYDDDKNTDE